MTNTMQAIQITGPGEAALIETPMPIPTEGEVLVRVEAVNTCPQWDLHILANEPMFPGGTIDYPYPIGQPGHEMAGVVAATGPGVKGFQPGMKVAAWRDPGKVRQGCYAQYVPFEATNLIVLPDELEPQACASLELAMCVQASFDQLSGFGAVRDCRVIICGLGPAGLIAVQLAQVHGASDVMALDPLPARRDMAARLGAAKVFAPDDPKVLAMLDRGDLWTTGIDCTGLAPALQHLMALCSRFVHVFGVLRDPVRFGLSEYRKGLALIGYDRHTREAAETALSLVADGRLDLKPLATHRLPLGDYLEGIDLLRSRQAVKVQFLPGLTGCTGVGPVRHP